jgi:hypothetical protein
MTRELLRKLETRSFALELDHAPHQTIEFAGLRGFRLDVEIFGLRRGWTVPTRPQSDSGEFSRR